MTNSCAETETTLALKVVRRDLKEKNREGIRLARVSGLKASKHMIFGTTKKRRLDLGRKIISSSPLPATCYASLVGRRMEKRNDSSLFFKHFKSIVVFDSCL